MLQDPDEDFIPSESEDDDDDENYLPEHDRRPYHRTSHVNNAIGRGLLSIDLKSNSIDRNSSCFRSWSRWTWPFEFDKYSFTTFDTFCSATT